MLDVARLVRAGDEGAAAEAHMAASRLAAHRSARFVADWLVASRDLDPDPAELDADAGGALSRLATLTTSAREKVLPRLGIRLLLGTVSKVDDGSALVVGRDGQRLSIPTPVESGTDWRGALVSVDIEAMPGGATTLWVRPAFDSEADPHERVPGGPHILTPAERDRLKEALASAR
ncbi:MAG: hypothetical protein ACRD29_08155 [Acidimicrobiales bacterium]